MTDIRKEKDTHLLALVLSAKSPNCIEVPRLNKFIGKELADTIKMFSQLQRVLDNEYIFTQKQYDTLLNGIEDYYLNDDEIMTKYGDA